MEILVRAILPCLLAWHTAIGAPSLDVPGDASIENEALVVTVQLPSGALSVQDKRAGVFWKQTPVATNLAFSSISTSPGKKLVLQGEVSSTHAPVRCEIALDGEKPELTIALELSGDLSRPVAFPQPFTGGRDLIVPMNEGVRYPVDDTTIKECWLSAYSGHGICMPFWGLTGDGETGMMAILETPDDAQITLMRLAGKLCILPQWEPQMGKAGYTRRLRYVFFDQGGFVAMCKRYRSHAQTQGLVKTLAEKRKEIPQIDLLIGSANVWFFDGNHSVPMARDMIAAGITRMLWSSATPPHIGELNQLGLLTGVYDIYQDIMNPAEYPKLKYIHHDWIPQAWPSQLARDAGGNLVKGWEVETKEGPMIPCGVLSDRFAPDYARERIKNALAMGAYGARFLDTTTASGFREDYSTEHPQTRTDCRRYRSELLKVVSEEFGLVTGSETGMDFAVPWTAYFEGMMSLTAYRLPDSGRDMQKIWTEQPPEDLLKFQTNPFYRLPLWELVYHDCTVSYWYWGDYNNKIPALWDRRDLINVLYGTPPLFMFDRPFWESHKDRFVQSYNAIYPVARATGYSQMTDFRWLTPDALVQQSVFANGVSVTVNFGDTPYTTGDGQEILPGGFVVKGLPSANSSLP